MGTVKVLRIGFLVFALSACSPPATDDPSQDRLGAMSSQELWQIQTGTDSEMVLALSELELARRGETVSGAARLGSRSAKAYGQRRYVRQKAVFGQGGKDCADFASSQAAQQFFIAAGGPARDPYGLDGDGDGLACEWGGFLTRITAAAPVRARAKAPSRAKPRSYRRVSSYICHTGPRGGRFHYSASGRKVYSGC